MSKIQKYYLLCLSLLLISVFGFSVAQEDPQDAASVETLTGIIEGGDNYFQEFDLQITETSNVTLDMNPTETSELDTYVKLIDRNNLVIDENDDVDTDGGDYTSFVSVQHLQPGNYRIVATRFDEAEGETTGEFTIDVTVSPIEVPVPYSIDDADLDENGFPALAPRAKASWTILAYYGADTNLEKDVINDFNEFELAGGSDETVRVIALMDRTPGHSTSNGDWSEARLFEISADQAGDEGNYPASAPTIDTTTLETLGEVDTGAGETLARFLVWGVTTYPADHYAVAFSSHGAAWKGIISDESDNYNKLSIPELRLAFSRGLEAAGVERFDLLINDACLMASVEYYAEMSNFFEQSLGSPEIVVSPAFNMTILAEQLKRNPDLDLNSLGRELVDTYVNEDSVTFGGGNAAYYSGVVTDMTEFDLLIDAINDFAALINDQPARYASLIGQARRNTYTYAAFMGFKTEVDPGDFMEQLLSLTDDEALVAEANKVLAALDAVRIHASAGAIAAERSSYYSIYFPAVKRDFQDRYYDETPLQEWGQMLRNYYTYAAFNFWRGAGDAITFHAPAAPQVTITNIFPDFANFNLPIAIDMEVVGNDIARGFFTIDRIADDGQRIRLLQQPMLRDVVAADGTGVEANQNVWLPGVDSRSFKWAATAYQVSDGANTNFEFLQQSLDGEQSFFLGGRYRSSTEDEWQEVRIVFTKDRLNEFDLRSASIISVSEGGTTGVIQSDAGAQFQSYQTIIAESGDQQLVFANTYTIPEDPEQGFVANEMPVASGDYEVSFEIQNFGGQFVRASRTVTADNNSIDPALRGQNFASEFGFTTILPAAWSDLLIENTVAWSSAIFHETKPGNPYPGSSVLFNTVPDADGSVEQLELSFVSFLRLVTGEALDAELEAAPVVIDGREALAFRYEEDTYKGKGWAINIPETEQTYVLMTYDQVAGETYADTLFDMVVDATAFYTPADLGITDANWTRKSISIETEFPLPLHWSDEPIIENNRTIYRPDSNSQTMAAFLVLDAAEIDVSGLVEFYAPAASLRGEQRFVAQSATWDAVEYTVVRDDVDISGRMYLTEVNGRRYAIQLETPSEDAATTFPQVLEPIASGFNIADRFYFEDYSDELGITWYRPGPRMPGNPWNRRVYNPSQQRLFAENFTTTERVEVYLFPEWGNNDVTALAERISERFETAEIVGDILIEAVDTREVAEFDIVAEGGTQGIEGRYFATYDEGRDLGLIIGAHALVGQGEFEAHYNNIKRRMTFAEADTYYPFRPVSEASVYDANSGFDVDIPAYWQTVSVNRNHKPNTDRYRIRRSDAEIWMFWLDNASADLEESYNRVLVDVFEVDAQGFRSVTIDGQPGLEVHGTVTSNGREGAFFIVYDEARNRSYVVGYADGLLDYQPVYDVMKASFEIKPLAATE